MLRNLSDLKGCAIHATDGDIGHVSDAYFDDKDWAIRYVVVDAGSWLQSRNILISPFSVKNSNWTERRLSVALTRERVKDSPDYDTHKPVSRQQELTYVGYYGYPVYWGGPNLWGWADEPGLMMTGIGAPFANPNPGSQQIANEYLQRQEEDSAEDDPHLRSSNAVLEYHVEATDGEIGHVDDMLFDDVSWAIRYLIVDTSNWWLGHKVLISRKWLNDINWADSTVSINLTREQIKNAPKYDPSIPMDRPTEIRMHRYYGYHGYWDEAGKLRSHKKELAEP